MIMADSFMVASRIQVKVVETCDSAGIGVGHDTDANDRSLHGSCGVVWEKVDFQSAHVL